MLLWQLVLISKLYIFVVLIMLSVAKTSFWRVNYPSSLFYLSPIEARFSGCQKSNKDHKIFLQIVCERTKKYEHVSLERYRKVSMGIPKSICREILKTLNHELYPKVEDMALLDFWKYWKLNLKVQEELLLCLLLVHLLATPATYSFSIVILKKVFNRLSDCGNERIFFDKVGRQTTWDILCLIHSTIKKWKWN